MAERGSQRGANVLPLTVGPYRLNYGSKEVVTGTGADWFGPLKPMPPIAPPTVKGRILDYNSGYNLNVRPRSGSAISFEMLRSFADQYDLLRLLIETRKDQMSRLKWNVVPRDKALIKKGAKVSPDIESRIAKIDEFFLMPDQENFWDEWLRIILEDLFVIDAPTLYRRKTMGGDLFGLQPIDGGTIKRIIDPWGHTPEPPDPAYQQILKGYPAVDYTSEELIYRPRVKRTNQIYGYSPVEQIVMTINIGLRRQVWQLESFTEGNIPEALIGTPATWTPDQVRQFQDWFDGMLQGQTGERRRARFVPGDVAKGYVPTKPSELFGAAEEWLIRVMCFAFNISPQPFVQMMNRATSETAQETAALDGLAPIQNWVKGLMDYILIKDFASPDLEFQWLEEDELDPNIKSQIIDREQAAGRLTYNEARREQGLDPYDHPDADRPMFKSASGWTPIFLTPEERAQKDAMAAALAAPPGGGKAPSQIPSDDKEVPAHPAQAEEVAKWDESQVERDEFGRFSGDGSGSLTGPQADANNISPTLVGRVSLNDINTLREAIAKGESQDEILEKMAPIYEAVPKAGDVTLVLNEDGNPPEGFWEGREYEVLGEDGKPTGERIGYEAAIHSLVETSISYAGEGGVVEGRNAVIVLGPSAAGKSTFAESIAAQTGSAIVDADDAKKIIPGYNGGLGANEVHEESSQMGRAVEARLTSAGANIVIPTVGANPEGIERRIDRLKGMGYNVQVVDVRVDKHEATRRMAERAISTGRPIGADYVRYVGDKPTRTYEQIKSKADGYARIDANGPRGTDTVTESHGVQFATSGQSVLRKGGESGERLRGQTAEGRVPGDVRSQEGLPEGNLQKGVAKEGTVPFPHLHKGCGCGLAKAGRASRSNTLDPLRPFAAKIEKKLAQKIAGILSRLKRSVLDQLKSDNLGKADEPRKVDVDKLLAELDLEAFALAQDELEDAISQIGLDAGKVALAQIGMTGVSESLVERVNERALNWARERAAELVSFDDDADPLLVSSTRDMIRNTIASGIEGNLGMPEIADLLEENYAFSEERALLIASTEITSANSMGALASYEEAEKEGVKVKKSWLILEDACDICQENADAGPIDLDEEFPSGDMAPGAHPNCRCVLVPEVEDEGQETDEDDDIEDDLTEGSSSRED